MGKGGKEKVELGTNTVPGTGDLSLDG